MCHIFPGAGQNPFTAKKHQFNISETLNIDFFRNPPLDGATISTRTYWKFEFLFILESSCIVESFV